MKRNEEFTTITELLARTFNEPTCGTLCFMTDLEWSNLITKVKSPSCKIRVKITREPTDTILIGDTELQWGIFRFNCTKQINPERFAGFCREPVYLYFSQHCPEALSTLIKQMYL